MQTKSGPSELEVKRKVYLLNEEIDFLRNICENPIAKRVIERIDYVEKSLIENIISRADLPSINSAQGGIKTLRFLKALPKKIQRERDKWQSILEKLERKNVAGTR